MPVEYLAMMIPFAGIGIGFFAIWTNHQQKMMKYQANISAEKAAQYAADKSQLEERVAVLERIVTDQGYSLAQEIENLRNDPKNSGVPLPEFEKQKEIAE